MGRPPGPQGQGLRRVQGEQRRKKRSSFFLPALSERDDADPFSPKQNPKNPNNHPKHQFADKYGANVDGYSPIYTPDLWSESGDTYRLGTKGLIAWAGLVVVLLGVGVTLIVSTSQLGA